MEILHVKLKTAQIKMKKATYLRHDDLLPTVQMEDVSIEHSEEERRRTGQCVKVVLF
jgi:hypothetical protein